MDYEKKYKEALERAKQVYKTPYTAHWDVMKELIEHLFPELKESEDERIRKALIDGFKRYDDGALFNGCLVREILDWLEKQGEQKPITDFSNLRTWKYIVDAVLTEKEGIGQYLDSPFTEELAKKLQKRFGNIEQMPIEWSEEDEERYLSCLKRLGTGDIRQPETINTVWLKSVKNRIQPKQEWSEEDEAMFQGVIETEQYMLDVVYGRKTFDVGNVSIKEECTKELAWLESLKDRIK